MIEIYKIEVVPQKLNILFYLRFILYYIWLLRRPSIPDKSARLLLDLAGPLWHYKLKGNKDKYSGTLLIACTFHKIHKFE